MTKKERETRRWVKNEIALEIRQRIACVPQRVELAPDPELAAKLWDQIAWDAAERIWPEAKRLT